MVLDWGPTLCFLLLCVLFFILYERINCCSVGRRFRPLSFDPFPLLRFTSLFFPSYLFPWSPGGLVARACGCHAGGLGFEADAKIFADVGNLLTMSVSAELPKDYGSMHLIHTIQSQEQHKNTPYKRLTLWN